MSSGHGGARSGAGRKPKAPNLRKVPKSLSLEQHIVDWLNETHGRGASQFVNDLLSKEKQKG